MTEKPLMNLEFREFDVSHFKEYLRWFEDDRIRDTLYGIDGEWLDHVLNDTSGVEYAVFDSGHMIGVVGIAFPTKEQKEWVVTNVAVNPKYFRKGLGSKMLNALLKMHALKTSEKWVAYVETKNINAQRFFEKNQWSNQGEEDDMVRFTR